MADDGHISDDGMEQREVDALKDEQELAALEQYLMLRGSCMGQAEDAEVDDEAMREALKRLQAKRKGE